MNIELDVGLELDWKGQVAQLQLTEQDFCCAHHPSAPCSLHPLRYSAGSLTPRGAELIALIPSLQLEITHLATPEVGDGGGQYSFSSGWSRRSWA